MSTSRRMWIDRLNGRVMATLAVLCGLLVVVLAAGLLVSAWPILKVHSLQTLLFSSVWRPSRGLFGFLPFIAGTVWVTLTAMALAVPLSLLTAIYLSEYAHRRVRDFMSPVIDLLAGIPSVIYGVWGILAVVPLVGRHSNGYTVLSAGIVLAVMVCPVIVNITYEVLRTIPRELREAALSLGATKWETVRSVVLRRALPGIIAANVLGFARAFGETMAVLMVAGNVAAVPHSIFEPAYPLPALIANSYGEVMSIPMYHSALLFGALLLFVIVLIFSLASRLVLIHVERRVL